MASNATTVPPAAPVSRRQQASDQRRKAILDAGLALFAGKGFDATRLDEVAERAGVAKGTIYLSFKDKEDLFEQIVIGAVAPVLTALEAFSRVPDLPFAIFIRQLIETFRIEILSTGRKEIIRLVLAEGGRFPRIAEFYHREVISRGIPILRAVAERAVARGELRSDALARFPQLVFAPLLLTIVWDGIFASIEPLDFEGLLNAHCELMLASASPERQTS